MTMKIALGADHGGYEIKEIVKKALIEEGVDVEDLGCHDKTSVDYPDYAQAVATRVMNHGADQGVLVCTTGLGMSMAANKFPGIRAALCSKPGMAEKAKTHNNANVLVLGASLVSAEETRAIVAEWLANSFSNEERHARRVKKIDDLPGKC